MTKKADFNAEEWSLVLEGPPIAGMIVIMAERGGTIRETISMAKAYTETRERHAGAELLDDILAAQPELDPKQFGSAEELRDRGQQRIQEAVALLEQKATPEEVDGYKRFVLDVADRAARAHKEGGVLGIGGKEVSESEQAALDRLAADLGIARAEPDTA
jgi:hypothetical protein